MRIPVFKARAVVRALERGGFVRVSQRGSHVKLRKGEITVIVPAHGGADVKRPTLRGILADAGLTEEEFIQWIS